MSASSELPTAVEIARALEERLVGQGEAVREMAIALSKRLSGLGSVNILLIGSSGTGKTTLLRAVESYLAGDPALASRSTVVRVHANVLGSEALEGRPGAAVLSRLLVRAREQLGETADRAALLERVGRGIVFIDEIDKIRSNIDGRANVAGIRAQEALLTLIENESVPFELPPWAGGETIRFDAGDLVFVAAGAFEGLYDSVYDRVTVGKDRGALQSVTVVEGDRLTEQVRFRLGDWLHNRDLFEYGMSPQFLSRFGSVVLLSDLGEDALVQIFLESPESGYRQSQAYFASHGLKLALSPAAVRRIAAEAAREPRLGARALQGVFRRVISPFEFDPAAHATGEALMIDLPEVEAALAVGATG